MIIITTINYWNNNNKIKLIVLVIMTLAVLTLGTKSHAANLEGLQYTQVEQGMNESFNYIDSNSHYVKIYAEGASKYAYVTIGYITDSSDLTAFMEAENLDGKLLWRVPITLNVDWGYVETIDDVMVAVVLAKSGNLYYPVIRVIDSNGNIAKTYQCEYGTTEDNLRSGALIKLNDKVYYEYPVDNTIVFIEIDSSLNLETSQIKVCDAGSSAMLFYDDINNALWTSFKYSNRGKIYEYIYKVNSLDDLSYAYASKNKVTREMLNANANFHKLDNDRLLINYAKKDYIYTYSTNKFVAGTVSLDKEIILDNETKKIFYEDDFKSTTQTSRTVYFVNKQGNYDVELFDENKTIYVGADGLIIRGIIHSSNDEMVNATLTMNNLAKNIELKTNEEFQIHLDSNFLEEGYYDEIYLEVGASSGEGILFGQIPKGAVVNYNGTFYDKIDETLLLERNPKSPDAVLATAYDSLNKSNFLTVDEYEKCKDYISAISRFNFWLQDGYKNYYSKLNSNKKVGSGYIIDKKTINLNECFTLNKTDGAYYNYALSSSKKKYNCDIWVSYAPCKEPIVKISSTGDFTKDNVKMTIGFEGECSDLNAYVHVIKENLEGVFEEDLTFDFTSSSICEYEFTDSGIYQISVIAKSSYGNKANAVIKTFKIDNEGPILDEVIFDNTYKSAMGGLWSSTEEIKGHVILKDLSGVKNAKQLDRFVYQIDVVVKPKKDQNVEVSDTLDNTNIVLIKNNIYVDKIEPILQNPEVEYFKDRAEITLRALDTESGLEGIYYKIGNEDEKKYEKRIVMNREQYGQHTEVIIYAKDIAGNKSNEIILDIVLNDEPEIVLEKECFDLTLDSFPIIQVLTSDKDNDVVTLQILYDDKVIATGQDELVFDTKQIEDMLKTLEYNESHKFAIVASDGEDVVKKNIYLIKKNMKPVYKISTKNINFSNYAEVDVSIYDLDDGSYGKTICNVSCNDVELGTNELYAGDNVIKIKNACLEGDNELKFTLINKSFRETITRKMKFIDLEKIEEKNVFIKISNNYSNEFYEHALESRRGIYFYTENPERYLNENLTINCCNLSDANEYIQNEIPVIICGEKINDENLLDLFNDDNLESVFCYESGSTVDINPIIFSDYENDYYLDNRGKNRKLNVKYEPLKFENTSCEYQYLIYDPFNNTTGNDASVHEVKFDKEKLDFDIKDSGLYTLSLSEWDEIQEDNVDYSKESDERTIKFYAHKKPVCKLEYEEVESWDDTVKLKIIKEAHDDDYLSVNNGILREKVVIDTYSFDGELLREVELNDCGKFFNIEVDKNQITKIKYIVWDFGLSPEDNRYSFSSFDELVINKINTNPIADFEYYVGNKSANGYIYRMTYHENLEFKNLSNYNDVLATSGEREERYEHSLPEFLEMIDDNDDLFNKLSITNKFGKKDTSISKKLEVCDIDLINVSNLDDIQNGFAILHFDILNANNKKEIYLVNDGVKYEYLNDGFYVNVYGTSGEFSLNLKVYSSRDDSYLGEKEFNLKFTANSEIMSFEILNIYDPLWEGELPVTINEMPTGVIRKGYAFDFDIKTRGLNNSGDYIYILPKFYYIGDNGIKPCEIVKYSHGRVYPYEMKILNNGRYIGTLDYLYLDQDDRVINNNDEIYLGKFYLPADCRIKIDDKIINEGLVLVNFNIVGASETGFSYNFNVNKWTALSLSPYNSSGDTAIFNLNQNALDDYKNYLKY